MRILADESVEGEVVAHLRSEGHDVAYVPETSAGIRDSEVLRRANAENRVLLTEDKDFGNLAFFYRSRSLGIVLLRAHGAGVETKARLVAEVLHTRGRTHEGSAAPRRASVGQVAEVPSTPRPRDRRVGTPRVDSTARVVRSLALVGEVHLFAA